MTDESLGSNNSKLSLLRQHGATQVDIQRVNILDAAEHLFLKQGLEPTTMADIAEQAGITRVTLYRYFANRDVIALEIYTRITQKLAALFDSAELGVSLEHANKLAKVMIRNFEALRDIYRFMGMFDALYLDHPPQVDLTHSTKQALGFIQWFEPADANNSDTQRTLVLLSTVLWFLEKVALRDELTWGAKDVPLEQYLQILEEMVTVYIAHLLAAR